MQRSGISLRSVAACAPYRYSSLMCRRWRISQQANVCALMTTTCSFSATPLCRQGSGGGDVMGGYRHPADASSSSSKRPLESEVMSSSQQKVENEAAKGYNPWEVLGLKPGATQHDVRLRYHELVKTCHPDLDPNGGNIGLLNQINKAYEIISKSPTLDKRYRNLVTDTQYMYYRFLPEWMAKNVDEMPRYWSWVKWRTPTPFVVFLWLCGAYTVGRFYAAYPFFTTVAVVSIIVDILLHTMIAPATFSMLFMNAILTSQSYDLAWLTSPKGFLWKDLGY